MWAAFSNNSTMKTPSLVAHHIRISDTDHSFEAKPGQTLLDAALGEGLHLPYGCRSGTCGACKATLVAGEVTYPFPPPALENDCENALLCLAEAASDVEIAVREIRSDVDTPARLLPVRVVEKTLLAHDVMKLSLQLPRSERLQYLAGQYVDIVLPGDKRRSFSLANAPHNDEQLELHIRKVPDGEFTTHVFETMRDKALMRINGPLGSFYLREDSQRPILLVAGGTGYAPMQAIMQHTVAAEIERPITLFWGAKARHDLYAHDFIDEWEAEQSNFRYVPVLSEPMSDDNWKGRTGWVHEMVLAEYDDLSGFDVYLAGPPPMIKAATAAFLDHGLPDNQLWFDSFEYSR